MKLNKRPKIVNDKRRYYRKKYLKSEHWKNLKAKKLKETPWCEKCYSQKFLDVHHIGYKNLYDVTVNDLTTLCRRCHDELHKKLNRELQIKRQKEKERQLRRKKNLTINHVAKMLNMKRGDVAKIYKDNF